MDGIRSLLLNFRDSQFGVAFVIKIRFCWNAFVKALYIFWQDLCMPAKFCQ